MVVVEMGEQHRVDVVGRRDVGRTPQVHHAPAEDGVGDQAGAVQVDDDRRVPEPAEHHGGEPTVRVIEIRHPGGMTRASHAGRVMSPPIGGA